MSFPSPTQQTKQYQPQNNLSSPNLHGSFKKSDLNIQLDKSPQQLIGFNQYSQPPTTTTNYGQMSNDMYTSGTSRPVNGNNTGVKLNEMSSDLAKLKQQLSKIMNQADKFEKRPLTNNSANNTKTSQQISSQSFTTPRYIQQSTLNPVNVGINNKSQQRISLNTPNNINQPYERKTQSSKTLSPQVSSFSIKPNTLYTNNFTQNKPKIIEHSQSQKALNFSPKKYSNYSTGQQLNNFNLQQAKQVSKPAFEETKSRAEFLSSNEKPMLKVRDEFKLQTETVNYSTVDSTKSHNEYQPVQQKSNKVSQIFNTYNELSPKKQQPLQQPFNLPQQQFSSPSSLTKKSSSSFSHQLIVNRIVNQQISKKLQQSTQLKQLRKKKQQQEYQYQQKIIELQHEKRKLKHQVNSALLEKENLQLALKTEKSQRQALAKKYQQLQDILKVTKLQLQQTRTKHKILQRKLQSQLSRPKAITQAVSFDQALKQQISEITKLKQQLEEKDEQILRIKDTNTTHRRQIDSLHNQIKIQQLKAASQLNESEQKYSITLQDKENQLKTLKNLCISLEAKLDVAVKQNRTKDAFMVQHLTGKVKLTQQKQYIENFFKNYLVEFPTNRFADKLNQELAQIQKLKKTILQMANIKK